MLRKYFVIGLVVLLPIVITVNFLLFIIEYFDQVLGIKNGRFLYVIPEKFHPQILLGFHIPGLGIIFAVLMILFVGVLSRNILGRRIFAFTDKVMGRIPLVRIIYRVIKEALETYASQKGDRFSRVVLIEYPRKGLYTMAFVTGIAINKIQEKTEKKVLNIFVPTTPNPTSGFYLMVPESDAIPLVMSVEDAFKLIISGGVVSPPGYSSPSE